MNRDVESVSPISGEYVYFKEHPDHDLTTYRRLSATNWEVIMGESWEPEYDTAELEAAYQEFKAT